MPYKEMVYIGKDNIIFLKNNSAIIDTVNSD